jgi:hypothetical protein
MLVRSLTGAPLKGMPLTLPTNIRLGWKGLSRTKTFAYYGKALLTAAKSFLTLAPGACSIKLFTVIIYGFL